MIISNLPILVRWVWIDFLFIFLHLPLTFFPTVEWRCHTYSMFYTFPFPIFLICIFSLFPSHTTKICSIFSLYSSISSSVISFFSMFSPNPHSCFIFYMVLFKSMHYSNIFVFPLMIPPLLHYFTYFFALVSISCVNALPLLQSNAQSFFHPVSIGLL